MFDRLRKHLAALLSHTSGNATMLVALGIPPLIGGAGIAVDMSQWYMWKRELQFAVDQAALAGAWARTSTNTSVQDTYQTRALQEYNSNVSAVASFDSTPQVTIGDFNGGTNNSVLVSASATKRLPFSSFLTNRSTTVAARARASFTQATTFKVCLLAIDPTANQAFKFGGSVTGSSACGSGALSNDPDAAMKEVGNTNVPLGKLVATGGIDQGFANNGTLFPSQSGLFDPYASLSTPDSSTSTSKTYSCPTAASAYTTADVTTRTKKEYAYYKKSGNDYVPYTYTGTFKKETSDDNPGVTLQDQIVTSTSSQQIGPTASGYVSVEGNGSNAVYEVTTTTKWISYSDIQSHMGNDGVARPAPGIYTNIQITCPTEFSPGIYFISGEIDFGQNQAVTATGGVMFVITGTSSSIKVNSNSVISLSGIAASTMTSAPYYYDATYAAKLQGMLFFDKNSTEDFTFNGNSSLHLGGVMYMPKRDVTFNGNSYLSGDCLMVASRKLYISGNFNVTNFCKPDDVPEMIIGGGSATVKLVV